MLSFLLVFNSYLSALPPIFFKDPKYAVLFLFTNYFIGVVYTSLCSIKNLAKTVIQKDTLIPKAFYDS